MWIEREIKPVVKALWSQRPVLLITGCRQAGKTALLGHLFPHQKTISLELPRHAEQAETAGEQFLAAAGRPLCLDEVQYAPSLFRYVKAAVDEERDRPGQYALTGSQKFQLMEGASESLAGRVAVINLQTLSQREIELSRGDQANGAAVAELVLRGGYPELIDKDLNRDNFFASYVATYLERDVRNTIGVRKLRDFERCMTTLALRCGQLVNMHAVAVEVGVSVPTISSWLSVLEASDVVTLLQPYHRNLGKRLIKTPKIYFNDTGLACFLAGIRTSDDLRVSGLFGAMFENHVFAQLLRSFTNVGRRPNVYFYRDQRGVEVDFVCPVGPRLHLIEVKSSERPPHAVKGFDEIRSLGGDETVLSATVVTSERTERRATNSAFYVADMAEWSWLHGPSASLR